MKPIKLFALSVVLILTGIACNLTVGDPDIPDSIIQGNPIILVTADPNAPTPTPFLPLDPTALAQIPTPIPGTNSDILWGDFPGPTVPSPIAIPPPVTPFTQPAGQVNYLLLGSDQRPNAGGFRTDVILLVTLNPNLGTATITSFPRDLYVFIPGWTTQRINTAQQRGGFEMMQDTFEYNFGVRPDRYVIVNFWSFVGAVNSLGGINVQVAKPLTDHREGYGNYTIPAGSVRMDGDTALWYVRARYTSSDFDRTRRQQEVLIATFNKLISLDGIQNAPELYDLYVDSVSTNIGITDITSMLGLAAQLGEDPTGIDSYYIGREHVTSYRTPGGAAVLLPKREAVLEVIQSALFGSE